MNLHTEHIQTSYTAPDNSHWLPMVEAAERGVFPLHLFTDEQGNKRVTWEMQQEDLGIFTKIHDLILETATFDDRRFCTEVLPKLIEIGKESPLFSSLDNDAITRSPAHKDRTPYQHITDVVKYLNTEGLSPEEKYWLRIVAFFHDTGKTVTAYMDIYQVHAKTSALIFQEFLRSQNLLDSIQAVKIIQYHHVFELVERRVLTVEQIAILLDNDPKAMDLLGRLAFADAWSVEKHREFALKNLLIYLEMAISIMIELSTEALSLVRLFVFAVVEKVKELVDTIEQTNEKLGETMKYFFQLIFNKFQIMDADIPSRLSPIRVTQ